MSLMTTREVVLAFVDRISHQDADGRRVYADNEPMYRLMEAYPPPA